ncbi:DsbC family protein [Sphingomonas sp. PP-CE-1G-424]|uniref:DsbC family protein n=1 Tax=Sphingomonas sp. PP-CE-1G-424 TaxID=2135658 RepID=UPI001055142E|nr:DsbC family protein [Sphingomonas sp. PP-CE-1G-424]TCP66177.1 thiol:disulfide interchange protein DsbC [Sphingomonas sp. PP-CE-1G-424]
MFGTDSTADRRLTVGRVLVLLLVVAAFVAAAIGAKAAYAALRPADASVIALLKARLPKTQVSKVDCAVVDGLCEVTAGNNLFYVDRSGRYLVIGRVYDMETRQDLTATRLLEINPDTLIGGAAKANNAPEGGEPPIAKAVGASAPAAPSRISLDGLPKDGAIVWGNQTGKTVTVFSDFRCGYCRALSNTLRSMNVRVVERPISVLGSRDLANQVYCAKNRETALHQAYAGEPLRNAATCDTSGLDANERFARSHGLNGTPVIVRADGAMIEGYRPKEALASFIAGGRS